MGFKSISQLIGTSDRLRLTIPNSKRSFFFNGNLIALIQKYPMLWGWLLDTEESEEDKRQKMGYFLANTYGLPNNPIQPNPEVAQLIEQKQPDVAVTTEVDINGVMPNETVNLAWNNQNVEHYLKNQKLLVGKENLQTLWNIRNNYSNIMDNNTGLYNAKQKFQLEAQKLREENQQLQQQLQMNSRDDAVRYANDIRTAVNMFNTHGYDNRVGFNDNVELMRQIAINLNNNNHNNIPALKSRFASWADSIDQQRSGKPINFWTQADAQRDWRKNPQ